MTSRASFALFLLFSFIALQTMAAPMPKRAQAQVELLRKFIPTMYVHRETGRRINNPVRQAESLFEFP